MEKLWIIEKINDEKTPYDILQEVCDKLEIDTKGLIVGNITSNKSPVSTFDYNLYLNIPSLDNYSYKLITMSYQNLLSSYAINLTFYFSDNELVLWNIQKEDFEKTLYSLIKIDRTRQILGNIKKHIDNKKKK